MKKDDTALKLISDYFRDKAYIKAQKRKWITPKPKKPTTKPV